MTEQSRRLVLAQRPSGMVDDTVVRLETVDVPEPGPGEAVVRVSHLSIDPTIRTWMDDAPGYLPPIEIDAVIRSGGLGTVVASQNDHFPAGATVFGMLGWQDHAVLDDTPGAGQVVPDGLDPTAVLSVFGVTGMTAYFGLLDIGEPEEGDTVVVSGAAGATGSVVGQIAKIKGAGKVVGIAGGPEKCAHAVDKLGYDVCVDHRADDWADVTAAFWLCTGSQDPLCTPAQLLTFGSALQDAGADWRVTVYGGAQHAFWAAPTRTGGGGSDGGPPDGPDHAVATVPGVGYHGAHAARAWNAILTLFDDTLRSTGLGERTRHTDVP